jgi:hypothetical protein
MKRTSAGGNASFLHGMELRSSALPSKSFSSGPMPPVIAALVATFSLPEVLPPSATPRALSPQTLTTTPADAPTPGTSACSPGPRRSRNLTCESTSTSISTTRKCLPSSPHSGVGTPPPRANASGYTQTTPPYARPQQRCIRGPGMEPLGEITIQAALHDITFFAHWIPTTDSLLADLLSLGRSMEIAELCPLLLSPLRHRPAQATTASPHARLGGGNCGYPPCANMKPPACPPRLTLPHTRLPRSRQPHLPTQTFTVTPREPGCRRQSPSRDRALSPVGTQH